MKYYLLTWNSDGMFEPSYKKRFKWSCSNNKSISAGDRFFLLQQGRGERGIIGSGVVTKGSFLDHRSDGKHTQMVYVLFDHIQISDGKPLILINSRTLNEKYKDQNWRPRSSGTSVNPDTAEQIEEDIIKSVSSRSEETAFNWRKSIDLWLQKKKFEAKYWRQVTQYFSMSFNHNQMPNQAMFGTSDHSIALLVGNIDFAAVLSNKGIILLVDQKFKLGDEISVSICKATKKFVNPLYWIQADISAIGSLLKQKKIWTSYGRASLKIFENTGITSQKQHTYRGKVTLSSFWNETDPKIGVDPIQIVSEDTLAFIEGGKYQIISSRYERDVKARNACLNHYGYSCTVCQVNMENIYGEPGKEYIQVHHILPLSKVKKSKKTHAIKDLIPVCPNCHAMLHRRNPPYTPNELASLMRNK